MAGLPRIKKDKELESSSDEESNASLDAAAVQPSAPPQKTRKEDFSSTPQPRTTPPTRNIVPRSNRQLPQSRELPVLSPAWTPAPSPYTREEVFVTDPRAPGVVRLRNMERPIMGRIFLMEPPGRPYSRNRNIDAFRWRRIFNLLRCYASCDREGTEEWLHLDTFPMLYQHIFQERFEQRSWEESDLLIIFRWMSDWVDLKIDRSGFAWVNLKEETDFILGIRVDEVTTSLKNLERESRREFERKEATPISVSLPEDQSSVEDRLRKNRIFGLLLEYYPMDSIELRMIYSQKFPRGPPLPPDDQMLDFCENFLAAICKVDQKSPVHGLLYPRLDLDFETPADFDLGPLAQTRRKVQRKLAARRLARPLRRRTLGRQRP